MRQLLLTAATLALATPAFAQSADPTSWTGFYAGARAGWNFQPKDGDETFGFDTNLDGNYGDTVRTGNGVTGPNAFSPGFCGGFAKGVAPASGCRGDKDSVEWAVHGGFDLDLGGPVIGAVAEFGSGYAEDAVSAYSTTPAYYTMVRTQKWTAGLRARAGYAFGATRDTLVYGTGGIVRSKIERDFRTSNAANSFTDTSDRMAWGWRAGGGVEQRVHPNLSVGLTYLFTSIDDNGSRVRVGPGTAPATNPFRLVNASGTDLKRSGSQFRSHSVSVAANVRF